MLFVSLMGLHLLQVGEVSAKAAFVETVSGDVDGVAGALGLGSLESLELLVHLLGFATQINSAVFLHACVAQE